MGERQSSDETDETIQAARGGPNPRLGDRTFNFGQERVGFATTQQTIGCILKSKEDIAFLKSEGVDTVLTHLD